MNKIDLIKAGAELNYVLGLEKPNTGEPGIDIYSSSEEQLKEDILLASHLICDLDTFTQDTLFILNVLKIEKERKEGFKRKTPPSDTLTPAKNTAIKEALREAARWRELMTKREENTFPLDTARELVIERIFKSLISKLQKS